jgi:glycosyltransferase involved in cell wall biosynthesis
MLTWSAEGGPYAQELGSFIKKQRRRYPLHEYIVYCNTQIETEYFKSIGIKAFLGHHNSLVDPNIYKINPANGAKDFLSVYTAALEPWKRHELCSKLESVGIIYWNYGPETAEYYKDLKRLMPQARFMNEELANPPHSALSAAQVLDVLHRSRVGLCLSAEEGGMHASVEYLLAGLPVVSTQSKGGRDFFFHDDFVEIADDTAEEVAAAVDRILARAPPAEEIRSRTIALQQRQIGLFIDLLDNIVRSEGGAGYTRAQWDACYCDKLLVHESLDAFLAHIPAAGSKSSSVQARVRRLLKRIKWIGRLLRR